jgi:uncharacterized protein YdaU (DUF1376 family)
MGKLPADMAWIMRKMRAISEADKAIVESVISEFFTRKGGKIFNDRLLKEWVKANVSHDKRISAGSKGGMAKSLKINDTNASNATAMQQHTRAFPEPEPEPEPEKKDIGPNPKSRRKAEVPLPNDWVPSDRNVQDAIDRNFSAEAISHEADQFRNHHTSRGNRFRDWDAAWRTWLGNAIKFAASRGVAGASKANGYGQRSSLASIAARRRAEGTV